MSEERVGTCSLCGGSVRGIRGAWMSVDPSPPDRCSNCGAVAHSDVVVMTLPEEYGVAVRQDTGEEIIIKKRAQGVLYDD